ncbi:spinocerebellar ataxia type 10 protein domain-containing protein [Gamsiella multidivaricata]|uniref:spinocerebellar ataxia type 10 protein domain-containing protein n=1 Tax=Gamsiella multidivaricata TaxID=101098 RepID=UPI0022205071|nr:spinocerebellar ataxia type 10 protein domain-containing protein [Gamsiella multidivaricata]KAI7831731.1 spinocerebellar ataxia type 10 protein domain-containing protein [Gamsiella multidivaricata]
MSAQQLITVLQDLVNASTIDNSWNQELDAVAKRLQVDADFRIEVGRHENVWSDIAAILRRVVKDGLDPKQVEQLMFLMRTIRNAVAGVTENQDQARTFNLPNLIQEVVSQAAHTHYGNVAYIMMLRAGIQALSNLLTGNNVSKDEIWKSLLVKTPSPSCDQNLLSTLAAIEDETIVLSTVMLCYNCIFESLERSDLLISTAAGRKLQAQLLNESHATSSKEERKSFEMIYTFFNYLIGQDYFPQMFETMKSQEQDNEGDYKIRYHGEHFHEKEGETIPKIQELGIEEVEDENDPSNAKKDQEGTKPGDPHLSAEQVILLKMIDSRICAHHQQQQKLYQQRQNLDSLPKDTEPPVSLKTVEFLTETFAKVSTLTIGVFRTLNQPGIGQYAVEDLANLSSGVMLLLGCFAHLSLFEDGHVSIAQGVLSEDDEVLEETERPGGLLPIPDWFKAQHMAMVNGGIVENAIELLRQSDKSLARVTKPVPGAPVNATTAATSAATAAATNPVASPVTTQAFEANTESTLLSGTSTMQGQQAFFVGLKRDIVRLVGNLAYRSRHVQDRIRQCNGLIVILSQCNIDDANPYLREYAILAMKNILAGNLENQALIEELQPIEAVDHPALQEARVTAHLDAETGRPVLTQKKP